MPETGEELMAVTASSSKDSSAREPTTLLWSLIYWTGQFKKPLKMLFLPALGETLPPQCPNNARTAAPTFTSLCRGHPLATSPGLGMCPLPPDGAQ